MSYTQPTDEMIAEARRANLCDYFRNNGYDVEQRQDELTSKASAACTLKPKPTNGTASPIFKTLFSLPSRIKSILFGLNQAGS